MKHFQKNLLERGEIEINWSASIRSLLWPGKKRSCRGATPLRIFFVRSPAFRRNSSGRNRLNRSSGSFVVFLRPSRATNREKIRPTRRVFRDKSLFVCLAQPKRAGKTQKYGILGPKGPAVCFVETETGHKWPGLLALTYLTRRIPSPLDWAR